jgi:tripartite-type tricarboxylate transporter receptor subunit TctC
MIESGVKDYDVALWFAYVVPAGTPDAIAARLNREMTAILSEPATAEALRKQGFEPEPGPANAVITRITSETETWRALVAKTGIKPE